MRICILCYRANPYSGGQGIYLKQVAEELVRQGHEVHAVAGPPLPGRLEGVNLHVVENRQYYGKKGRDVLPTGNPLKMLSPLDFYEYLSTRLGSFTEISTFSIRAFSLVKKLHREKPFDIIHDNQSLGYGLLLFKSLGVPVTATIHHPLTIDLKSVLHRVPLFKKKMKTAMFYPVVMQSIVSRFLDHVITVSEASQQAIHRDFGLALSRMTVVYNGIDSSLFRPLPVRKVPGQLIFVGNIEDGNKGFVTLLRAMRLVPEHIHLLVVDGGSVHRKITSRFIELYGLEQRITFKGKASHDELLQYYNQSECAITPSFFEGFGLPAGEALACGLPVISSDGGALPEVVGDAGLIFPAGDEILLARAIVRVMGNAKLRKELSRKGLARVRKLFRWERAVQEMVKVFEGLQ